MSLTRSNAATASVVAPSSDPAAEPPMRFYSAPRGWQPVCLRDLWDFRALIWAFAARDVQVRYRQTIVGIAWAIVQPTVLMLLFATMFSWLKVRPTLGNTPFVLSIFCGLIPWNFFANSLNQGTGVLVVNQHVITKVYFPRIILPVASLLVNLLDAAFASIVFVVLMLAMGEFPSLNILALPLILLMEMFLVIGFSLWLSALNAMYRDIQVVVPFLLLVGMFASPVVYDSSAIVPSEYYWIYAMNPMVGVLQAVRWSVLDIGAFPIKSFAGSVVVAVVVFVTGLFYFRRVESALVDRI